MTAVLASGLAFGLTLALTPLMRWLAPLIGATDLPGERRVHLRPMPRAGGLAVAVGVAGALAVTGHGAGASVPWILAGALLLVVVGLIDDIVSLRAETKLFAQVIAAGLAVVGGVRYGFFGPDPGTVLVLIDAALTLGTIVIITNALNLTDGLDGLASGIGIIALLWLSATVLRRGDTAAAILPLAVAGGLLGFLPYNFNPATIFLGDVGSLLIGYALAVLPLVAFADQGTPPLAALLLVALPATDTLLAITRRFLSRCLREWGEGRPLAGLTQGLGHTMSPDRRHIHHRLIDLGFSQRRAVLLLYLAAASTGGMGYLVARSRSWPMDLFALGVAATVIALVRTLGFNELQPARSGLVLPILRRIARRRWVHVVSDLALATAAYAGSRWLTGQPHESATDLGVAIGLTAGAQLLACAFLGVYRTAWWHTDASGFGLLVRACAVSTVAGYAAIRLLELPAAVPSAFVQFSLLLPAVTLMRFSSVILTQAAAPATTPERALVCGTIHEARQAMNHMRRNGLRGLDVVGLVEVKPRFQGRQFGRLSVVGTLQGLDALVREREVKHLVLAGLTLDSEDVAWVRAVCRQLAVQVHCYVEKITRFDDLAPALDRPQLAAVGNGRAPVGANGNGNGDVAAEHGSAERANLEGARRWS
jgi:UDP-GlcNAc:undecaprenyl-phosphate GlcNAc-1-phosphate transferase